MPRIALITGITGQDGPYLAVLLLSKGYEVHGLRQPSAVPDLGRLASVLDKVHLHYGDLVDGASINALVQKIKPHEIYNLAAQSHVHISFATPEYTAQVNGLGVVRFLEAIRIIDPTIRFFQASTSELFGDTPPPHNEQSLMNARSPYAAAKKYAYDMVKIYREAYGLYACNGIMFNHESETRGDDFVTRKIVKAITRQIYADDQNCLYLGNLNALRDWSCARDIMEGAWRIMQQPAADDFVLASGESVSVRAFVETVFWACRSEIVWEGEGIDEVGKDKATGQIVVRLDPALFRPLEVENLCGDSSKARGQLQWAPRTSLETLVKNMVSAELKTITPALSKVQQLYG